jgi:hypothetical protein
MAVVRINKKLLDEIKKYIEKEENAYKYPSISSFVNIAVFEKLNNDKKKLVKKW